jgi:hypothetical protein
MSEPVTTSRKQTRKATEVERRKINRLLDSHLKRVSGNEDEPGECEYLNDMDDVKIAAMVSPTLSPTSVANIRLQVFGKIHREDPEAIALAGIRAELLALVDDKLTAIVVRMDGFEERLKQMEGVILDLCTKHNRFVTLQCFGDDKWHPAEAERCLISTSWERRHGEEIGK